jgi:hypothetical protein
MPHRAFGVLYLLVAVALLLAASSALGQNSLSLASTDGPLLTPTNDLSATVDHALVPLTTVTTKIFAGEALDEETGNRMTIRTQETVLPDPEPVAGIAVTVVEASEYHNGELVETDADYFAQGPDGTVHSVGERVDQYEQGKVVSHDGAWLSGEQGTRPGVFMPADPGIGKTFTPQHLSDVGIEQATVIAVEQAVTVPAGTFEGCVVTKDVGFPDGTTEEKTYCPGVGLVREEYLGGQLELVQFETTS